jgi:hypothetical protein
MIVCASCAVPTDDAWLIDELDVRAVPIGAEDIPDPRPLCPRCALDAFMSAISERAYNASWENGLEFALWEAVERGPRPFGRDGVYPDDIEALKRLSNAAGGWLHWTEDDAQEQPQLVALPEWERLYRERHQADDGAPEPAWFKRAGVSGRMVSDWRPGRRWPDR